MKINQMGNFYTSLLLILFSIMKIKSYHYAHLFHSFRRPVLQTASTGLSSHIPRLELGIKSFFRTHTRPEYDIPFTMDWQLDLNRSKKPGLFTNMKNIVTWKY